MRTVRCFASLLLALAAGAIRASAQTCGTNTSTKFTLTVLPASASITSPTATDFNAGVSKNATYTIIIAPQNPSPWYLCIESTSANMGTVNGYTKPLSDLQWSLNGTTFTSFTTTYAQMATGAGVKTYTLYVRSKLAWANDQPRSNTASFTYGPVNFNVQVAH